MPNSIPQPSRSRPLERIVRRLRLRTNPFVFSGIHVCENFRRPVARPTDATIMETVSATLIANARKDARLGRCAFANEVLHKQIKLRFSVRIRGNACECAIF